MPSIAESRYCAAHYRQPNPSDISLANELAQAAGSLNSPESVDRALANVFLAVAEDRIEPRKAYPSACSRSPASRPPSNCHPEKDQAGIRDNPAKHGSIPGRFPQPPPRSRHRTLPHAEKAIRTPCGFHH
jgi:hypothetical protein